MGAPILLVQVTGSLETASSLLHTDRFDSCNMHARTIASAASLCKVLSPVARTKKERGISDIPLFFWYSLHTGLEGLSRAPTPTDGGIARPI